MLGLFFQGVSELTDISMRVIRLGVAHLLVSLLSSLFGFILYLLYGGSKEAIGTTVGADVGDAVAAVGADVELIGTEVGADVGA